MYASPIPPFSFSFFLLLFSSFSPFPKPCALSLNFLLLFSSSSFPPFLLFLTRVSPPLFLHFLLLSFFSPFPNSCISPNFFTASAALRPFHFPPTPPPLCISPHAPSFLLPTFLSSYFFPLLFLSPFHPSFRRLRFLFLLTPTCLFPSPLLSFPHPLYFDSPSFFYSSRRCLSITFLQSFLASPLFIP